LLSVLPVGIAFSYDLECRTVILNPAAEQILGVDGSLNPSKSGPDAELLPYRVLQGGSELPPDELPLQRAARTGESVRGSEYEIVREDGRVFPVICWASPLLDQDGRPRGSVAALLDISERKSMENALRRANAALEQFAYAAAHDLQEPVRNLAVYTQLLARNYAGRLDRQADEFMQLTVEGARRMQNLIQDLLSYTRATDEREGSGAEADAAAAFEEVIQNLRTAIEVSHAQVTYDSLPEVGVHHTHLVQLLQNLVSNALKYRGTDIPRVHVSAQRQGCDWMFVVRDNGPGISSEHHQRIFRVFKRLHGRDVPGNGIGLAICERIVTHYGGRIWVESEPGYGAAFHFTVPDTVKSA
ncbi:MAG TPA: ATP-binding protein, partial [Bryobacteraceae bacterium]|nr:ATP-binding protein [Bryobacteraceae bacterium]